MTAVGAFLRYPQIEPVFQNSSHGQPPSTRENSSLLREDCTLFIVLPSHHIWAPHTIQRAVFSKSSRSRASTTLFVDHLCSEGCCEHPSHGNGLHVPLLRKVEDIPCPEQSRTKGWRHLMDRSSQSLPRPLSRLIHSVPKEEPDTKRVSRPWSESSFHENYR